MIQFYKGILHSQKKEHASCRSGKKRVLFHRYLQKASTVFMIIYFLHWVVGIVHNNHSLYPFIHLKY